MSKGQTGIACGAKMFFGFFMVLVYLGMAALMAINFFDLPSTPLGKTMRWAFAVILCAYGLYRAYREVKGDHTYGMRRYDDDEDTYTTYTQTHIEDNDEKK